MVFLVKWEVKESPEHGKGIYAAQDIPKGTKVWAFSRDDCVAYNQSQMYEMARSDPGKLAWVLWGGYHHDPTDTWVHYDDGMWAINHSKDENIGNPEESFSEALDDECEYALRDIKCGEELVENYSLYNDCKYDWLAPLFKRYCRHRYLFMDSIYEGNAVDAASTTDQQSSITAQRIIRSLRQQLESLDAQNLELVAATGSAPQMRELEDKFVTRWSGDGLPYKSPLAAKWRAEGAS